MKKKITRQFKSLIAIALLLLIGLACRIGERAKPTVSILTPANDQKLTLNQETIVQSVSVSPDGISRVELWVNGELVDVQTANDPQSYTALQPWIPEIEGVYVVEIRAFDANHLRSDPALVTVSVASSSDPLAAAETPTPTAGGDPTVTTKTDLNVRTGPSTDFAVLSVLPNGQSARIIGVNVAKTWWLIEYAAAPDGRGWISAHPQYSTATNIDGVPVVSTPPLPATATPLPAPTATPNPEVQLPTIHYFRAARLNILAGESVLLQWDLSGAQAAYLYPGGEAGVVAPGDLQVAPKSTTTYRLVARNQHGEVEAVVTIEVSAPLVIFDFIARGAAATWRNGRGVELPWNGKQSDVQGYVLLHPEIVLENDTKYTQVLETQPERVANGSIEGNYELDFPLQSGDRFVAEVGFLKGATSPQGVTFRFCYASLIEIDCLHQVSKSYNNQLTTFEVDLSSLNGYNSGWFKLWVEANGAANKNWPVWLRPRIERP